MRCEAVTKAAASKATERGLTNNKFQSVCFFMSVLHQFLKKLLSDLAVGEGAGAQVLASLSTGMLFMWVGEQSPELLGALGVDWISPERLPRTRTRSRGSGVVMVQADPRKRRKETVRRSFRPPRSPRQRALRPDAINRSHDTNGSGAGREKEMLPREEERGQFLRA